MLGQQHIARDDRLLGDGRPAGQPEFTGERALVHLRAFGESRLLGVLRDHAVERLHVFECATHQEWIGDALAVVGEDPDPGARVRHRPELRQALASEPDRHRPDGAHRGVACPVAERQDLLDDAGRIRHR